MDLKKRNIEQNDTKKDSSYKISFKVSEETGDDKMKNSISVINEAESSKTEQNNPIDDNKKSNSKKSSMDINDAETVDDEKKRNEITGNKESDKVKVWEFNENTNTKGEKKYQIVASVAVSY